MVLALSLPQHFPFREMLINLVFGVVLLTILIQGLSISPVARALGVLSRRHLPADFEMQRVRLTLAQMGIQEIDRLRHEGVRDPQALDALTAHYSQEQSEENNSRSII